MLLDGIIEPSFSLGRAQVLVACDERHKPRMVVDYSQTINRFTLLNAYRLPNIDEQIAKIAKKSVFSTLDLKSAYYQLPLHAKDRPYTAFKAEGKLHQYTRLPFGVTNRVSFFQRFIDFLFEKYLLRHTYAYLDNLTVCGVDSVDYDAKLNALLSAAKNEGLTFHEDKCNFNQREIKLLGYNVSHAKIRPNPERLRSLLEMSLPQTSYLGPIEPDLVKIHKQLGHPGISCLYNFIRSKNLPYSVEEVKKVCTNCRICAEVKPRYYNKPSESLIKSTRPWERVSADFKGPVAGRNNYIFFVVDEFSRYPFAIACNNISSSTVIKCLSQLFCLFGFPAYIHCDKGSAFISKELNQYLNCKGIATTTSTSYHPTGNAQCERINQTVWRKILLLLRTHKQQISWWEAVLPEALHAERLLLCTATNATPHERFLGFSKRSMVGKSLPSWLIQPEPVLKRRFVRSKSDPLVDEVELLEAYPNFARIRSADGRESSVFISDLAPCPSRTIENTSGSPAISQTTQRSNSSSSTSPVHS